MLRTERTCQIDQDASSVEKYHLEPSSSTPLYRQLVEQITRRVISGQLGSGEEMPSVRDLARELRVNPMTVSKAYGVLQAEGLLMRRRGLNMVVAGSAVPPTSPTVRAKMLRPSLERAAVEASELNMPVAEALALFKAVLTERTAHVA